MIVCYYYILFDFVMCGWMNDVCFYILFIGLGEVMWAGFIGEVVVLKNDKFVVGDIVIGWGGVQEYSFFDGKNWYKVDINLVFMIVYIGILGMLGMIVYFGILEVGKIKEGDVVLVFGVVGVVGSVVGQIVKIKGCIVVGIVGGKEKCIYFIEEFGFDVVIDYKNENVVVVLKEYCLKGIDVYFDNVGGDILDMVLVCLCMYVCVVICGVILQYNNMGKVKGFSNYFLLFVN